MEYLCTKHKTKGPAGKTHIMEIYQAVGLLFSIIVVTITFREMMLPVPKDAVLPPPVPKVYTIRIPAWLIPFHQITEPQRDAWKGSRRPIAPPRPNPAPAVLPSPTPSTPHHEPAKETAPHTSLVSEHRNPDGTGAWEWSVERS